MTNTETKLGPVSTEQLEFYSMGETEYDTYLAVEDEFDNMVLYIFGEEFIKVQKDGKVLVRGEQVDDNQEIYRVVKEAWAKLLPINPLP